MLRDDHFLSVLKFPTFQILSDIYSQRLGGINRILPILQMRKLRPREGERTCPGSHSKFVVEPGTESMSPRLCPFPVPQFPSLLKWEQHCPSRYTKDRPSLPAMHVCPSCVKASTVVTPLYTLGLNSPNPLGPLMVLKGNKRFPFQRVGSSDNVTIFI